MSLLPYPGRYESHASWMSRCDEWKRNRKLNNERDSYTGRRLTENQRRKLARANEKLPSGWSYMVSDDNNQILVSDGNDTVACGTRHEGRLSGWTNAEAIYLNRACAAVWGRQMTFSRH